MMPEAFLFNKNAGSLVENRSETMRILIQDMLLLNNGCEDEHHLLNGVVAAEPIKSSMMTTTHNPVKVNVSKAKRTSAREVKLLKFLQENNTTLQDLLVKFKNIKQHKSISKIKSHYVVGTKIGGSSKKLFTQLCKRRAKKVKLKTVQQHSVNSNVTSTNNNSTSSSNGCRAVTNLVENEPDNSNCSADTPSCSSSVSSRETLLDHSLDCNNDKTENNLVIPNEPVAVAADTTVDGNHVPGSDKDEENHLGSSDTTSMPDVRAVVDHLVKSVVENDDPSDKINNNCAVVEVVPDGLFINSSSSSNNNNNNNNRKTSERMNDMSNVKIDELSVVDQIEIETESLTNASDLAPEVSENETAETTKQMTDLLNPEVISENGAVDPVIKSSGSTELLNEIDSLIVESDCDRVCEEPIDEAAAASQTDEDDDAADGDDDDEDIDIDVDEDDDDEADSIPEMESRPSTSSEGAVRKILPFLTLPNLQANDDVRNKIREQLELLRMRKKPAQETPAEPVRSAEEIVEEQAPSEQTAEETKEEVAVAAVVAVKQEEECQRCPSNNEMLPVKPDLDEVLISNEGEHLIVSVVGGYVSDTEEEEAKKEEEVPKKEQEEPRKKTSMTDILLKRDFSSADDPPKDEAEEEYLIKPTKTKDITKIKGWKKKKFAVEKAAAAEATAEEAPEAEAKNSFDITQPSTSTFNPNESGGSDTKPLETSKILKQGENKSSTRSVFTSDVLDSFLSNHSQLKISYEVPKLIAEEAISKVTNEVKFSLQSQSENANPKSANNQAKKNEPKPKTVAEKRRMLQLEKKNRLIRDMKNNETMFRKQLEREEKRNKADAVKSIRKNLVDNDTPFTKDSWSLATRDSEACHQYAYVNGCKIRLVGSSGGKDLHLASQSHKKALLEERAAAAERQAALANRRRRKSFEYKPGPLSKKRKLIKHSKDDNWEIKVVKMPKIKLVLYPEQGKPVDPVAERYLELCKDEKGFISDTWAKFAVTAVRTGGTAAAASPANAIDEKPSKSKIEFEIPYRNNQNKILVRRKVPSKAKAEAEPAVEPVAAKVEEAAVAAKPEADSEERRPIVTTRVDEDDGVDGCVRSVVADMLRCVENQSLDVIREDPDARFSSREAENGTRPPSPVNPMVQAIIKRPNHKRSRTTLELRRLNVQVIEVDVADEQEPESAPCDRDFCRLGCVCKSLQGINSVPDHCGREQCMFECRCSSMSINSSSHHSVTLPAGTDLLSTSTMVRLEDEAKRHLAKEEKKFTQTVIKANNQTIVVGGGARDRSRRVTKFPKKFMDHVITTDELLGMQSATNPSVPDAGSGKEEPAKPAPQELKKPVPPIWKTYSRMLRPRRSAATKSCFVKLERLNVDMVPWCMYHDLYKCYCGGAVPADSERDRVDRVAREAAVAAAADEDDVSADDDEYYVPYASRQGAIRYPDGGVSEVAEKHCARTRALVSNFYQARNRSQSFKAKFAKMKAAEDAERVDTKGSDDELLEVADRPPEKKQKKLVVSSKLVLVKQQPPAMQKKKTVSPPETSPTMLPITAPDGQLISSNGELRQNVELTSLIDYEKSYQGLLTPTKLWLGKLTEMLNLSDIKRIRLLEWTCLVERYKKNLLQLWFANMKPSSTIVLSESRKRPSKNHMNIKVFDRIACTHFKLPDIITSLVNDRLPGKATCSAETFVIIALSENSSMNERANYWHARGTIVLKNTNEMCKVRLAKKPTPQYLLDTVIRDQTDKNSEKPSPKSTGDDGGGKKSDNNGNGGGVASFNYIRSCLNGLEITKLPSSQKEGDIPIVTESTPTIMAALPLGTGLNRWFMLILENDFNVMRLAFLNFHIKYTHLTTAIQMARRNRKTVRVRTQDVDVYGQSINANFGVYAVPEFNDRIFMGPYDDNVEHGIEMFRYVNGKLVNTKIYHRMRGNAEKKTRGMWFNQTLASTAPMSLVPEYDNNSSSSECSVEVVNPRSATKPQIEFVDLTENDSENEEDTKANEDPLFSVLTADFSKHLNNNDITIEPIYDRNAAVSKTNGSTATSSLATKVDINALLKRKVADELSLEPVAASSSSSAAAAIPPPPPKKKTIATTTTKSSPPVIDTINLDDDSTSSSQESSAKPPAPLPKQQRNKRKLPELVPISVKRDKGELVTDPKKSKSGGSTCSVVWHLVPNILQLGSVDVGVQNEKSFIIPNFLQNDNTVAKFSSISDVEKWLETIVRKRMFVVPKTLTIKFKLCKYQTESVRFAKFDRKLIDGVHMLCEKGVFNLKKLTTEEINKLDFPVEQKHQIIDRRTNICIDGSTRSLGLQLFGTRTASALTNEEILQLAPKKIGMLEQREDELVKAKRKLLTEKKQLLHKINVLSQNAPEVVKSEIKKNMANIRDTVIEIDDDGGKPTPQYVTPDGRIWMKSDTNSKSTPVRIGATQVNKSENNSSTPLRYKIVSGNLLVPIEGVQNKMAVVDMKSSKTKGTSLLLKNNNNQSSTTNVVDLT